MTPIMYRIEIGGKPYLEPVKKFAVSRDLRIAALVTNNNQILVYNLFEQDGQHHVKFVSEQTFKQNQK